MNKVMLTGRITRDPEVKHTSTGISQVRFSIAVDRQYQDASGNRQADFINCVAWRNQADFLANYVRKGYMLAVEGRLQTNNYQGQDGMMHYTMEVLCDRVENLTPRQTQNVNPQPTYNQPVERPSYVQPSYEQAPMDSPNTGIADMDIDDNDLPF